MMVPEALVALIESSLRAAISAEFAPPSHAVAVSVIVHATAVGAPSSYSVNVQAQGPPAQLTLVARVYVGASVRGGVCSDPSVECKPSGIGRSSVVGCLR